MDKKTAGLPKPWMSISVQSKLKSIREQLTGSWYWKPYTAKISTYLKCSLVNVRRVSSNRPTNTIWYGPDVPPWAVELVTEILIEKGLDIVEVKPFSIADGKEAKIQVGSQEYVK